jgi:hypothetical protein
MKGLIRTILLSLAFAVSLTSSNGQSGPIDEISSSIQEGNIAGISKYFDNAVSITTGAGSSTYSRSQAEMVLRDFFSKNHPKSLEIEHTGGGSNSKYAIGVLETSNGNFKIYIMVKLKDGNYILQEIRLEK